MEKNEHILGNLKILNKGNKPNRTNVKQFLDYSLVKIKSINLDANVHGRVLNDWKITNDFDLRLTGNIVDYDQVENLFFDLFDFAFNKINLKLDLKWVSNSGIVRINEQDEIVYNDVEYITIGYWTKTEQNNAHIKKITFSYDTYNKLVNYDFYTPVSQWLVKSNYVKLTVNAWLYKIHQEEEIRKHGKYMFISAEEFLTHIDDYFRE